MQNLEQQFARLQETCAQQEKEISALREENRRLQRCQDAIQDALANSPELITGPEAITQGTPDTRGGGEQIISRVSAGILQQIPVVGTRPLRVDNLAMTGAPPPQGTRCRIPLCRLSQERIRTPVLQPTTILRWLYQNLELHRLLATRGMHTSLPCIAHTQAPL